MTSQYSQPAARPSSRSLLRLQRHLSSPWRAARALTLTAPLVLGACGEAAPLVARKDAGTEVAPRDQDAGADRAAAPCPVPSEAAALIAFLRAGSYRSFRRESAPHASTGPHGGRVLTYVNDVLARSLEQGRGGEGAQHPRCAASVKELFLGGEAVAGWAVLVKTDDDSAGGRGLYWLETTTTSADRAPAYQGQGLGLCVNCHAAGRDHVLTPWPLQ